MVLEETEDVFVEESSVVREDQASSREQRDTGSTLPSVNVSEDKLFGVTEPSHSSASPTTTPMDITDAPSGRLFVEESVLSEDAPEEEEFGESDSASDGRSEREDVFASTERCRILNQAAPSKLSSTEGEFALV